MRYPTATSRIAVQLDDLRKHYQKGTDTIAALSGVSIGFARGTFTAVMGPSGSGKSTMLQCAAGLDQPTSGTVTLDDIDLSTLSEKQLTVLRRERVGFIFQSLNLLPTLTAEQNIAVPLRLAGREPTPAAVRKALDEVGLGDRRHHLPNELSGGQRQRVAVARALLTRPAVIFADEPTGSLDTRSGREVVSLLRSAVHHDGLTIVMVTHNPAAAGRADHVVFLADGQISSELADPTAETVAERMATLGAWTLDRPLVTEGSPLR